MGNNTVVGKITQNVIDALQLSLKADMPIYIGDQNIAHMSKEHPADFQTYFPYLRDILQNPDYVALHPKRGSLEYIKVFREERDVYVLVAVRLTSKKKLFARTLFVMSEDKVAKYREEGSLKRV
ncbi:PBECR3 domain-containing polyvalent protein [Paenibacillus sp. GYB003]|uniref:PBECR3 domain-containing polyvalent protein n=1 Tax=Paenibacillus sp. GYB003 TaxID=2994392 RepID=UPI002F964703